MNKKVILLCSDCFSSRILYNHLSSAYTVSSIIVEEPMRGSRIVRRRIKTLGFFRVAGQVLFSLTIVPCLNFLSKSRIKNIRSEFQFDETALPLHKITRVGSVNDPECDQLLRELQPDIVIVNGTRIISRKILSATEAIFINMHTGITPRYRGVHGGYWANANNDRQNCGVTIHRVDKGIDTGKVLKQGIIDVTRQDNFVTYPFLQFGIGLPLFAEVLGNVLAGRENYQNPMTTDSRLWSHPTFWQYLYLRIFKGKK